jgi:hypothetical protein
MILKHTSLMSMVQKGFIASATARRRGVRRLHRERHPCPAFQGPML